MATQIAGRIDSFAVPGFSGELFTISPLLETPMLNAIGNVVNGSFDVATTKEFIIAVTQGIDITNQPISGGISEADLADGNFASSHTDATQLTNVIQTYADKIEVTYDHLATSGQLEGNLAKWAGQSNNGANSLENQVNIKMARFKAQIERDIFQGTYNKATTNATKHTTRGLVELCSTGNTIDALAGALTKTMLDNLMLQIVQGAGSAYAQSLVLWADATQTVEITNKIGVTDLQPRSENRFGINVNQIVTPWGVISTSYSPGVPAKTLVLANMDVVSPVINMVPGKGNFFTEQLAKEGGADRYQIIGYFGLNHGPREYHGTITNLA